MKGKKQTGKVSSRREMCFEYRDNSFKKEELVNGMKCQRKWKVMRTPAS